MTLVYSEKGDTVDQICLRAYGSTGKITEQVLSLNPGISKHGPLLPSGIAINLPNVPVEETKEVVNLWD